MAENIDYYEISGLKHVVLSIHVYLQSFLDFKATKYYQQRHRHTCIYYDRHVHTEPQNVQLKILEKY